MEQTELMSCPTLPLPYNGEGQGKLLLVLMVKHHYASETFFKTS